MSIFFLLIIELIVDIIYILIKSIRVQKCEKK